ncbi:2,3-dehydroadipyl-CoA hydratase [Alphaproteobacteria bacterium SO-S41]|nr:2,3-dehydroadipyl-CoA hydratase [Alphaproteobacteria bacterium SO-S41]
MTEHVEITREGHVQILRLTRADKKNALTPAMYAALADALNGANSDDGVRATVITGSGGCFTAGNDIGDFASGAGAPTEGEQPVTRFLKSLATHTKPLIAAVEGVAVGVGVTLLFHCDFVVAAEGARLQTPFVNLGLVPEAASSLLMPRISGHQLASEMLLFGERFGAAEGKAAGFVNRVTPTGGAEAVALEAARAIAAKPPEAVRLTKALLRGDPAERLQRMEEEGKLFAQRMASAEAREAFSAFLEKRPADFSRSAA